MANTILIIDDSITVRRMIHQMLETADLFDVFLEAEDGEQGYEMMQEHDIDVILCDLDMPGINGFDLLRRMANAKELRDIPVIIITGHEDREQKLLGLNLGASDFITKPFDPAELKARVKIQLKLKILQDHLRELANTDVLTKLCNRRCMLNMLTRETDRSLRTGKPLSLAMIDIDHFKKINDTYGHSLGDKVLIEFSRQVQLSLRPYDQAARFGGEEFAIILPETNLEQAAHVAERVRRDVSELSFQDDLKNLKMTISIGVAPFPATGIRSLDDLIREADNALYLAKTNGRNRVELWRERRRAS
ncbi:MAG: diguanylate cyclase response regulator [Desulfuromonas sp.]|nr:MAG: diguanylate cyclase response regulator [Desulfuromonas sp.]